MSRTIKAIERHMIPKPAAQPIRSRDRKPVAEILGHTQRKLRFAFAPMQSPAIATLRH
jgi:hypothetical protein